MPGRVTLGTGKRVRGTVFTASRKKARKRGMADVAGEQDVPGGKEKTMLAARLIPGVDGTRIFGFPNKIITKMRYVEEVIIATTLGTVGRNVWSMNSIFDPNRTGVGHQPLYRDQWAAIYNHYRVLGSSLTARYTPLTGGNTIGPWIVGISGEDDATGSTIPETLMEQSNSTWAVLGRDTGGNDIMELTATYSPETKLGKESSEDGVGAAVGSNPVEEYFTHTWVVDANGASQSVIIVVEINYTVEFSELTTPTAS